jgi:hypothetical protein
LVRVRVRGVWSGIFEFIVDLFVTTAYFSLLSFLKRFLLKAGDKNQVVSCPYLSNECRRNETDI